MTLKYQQAIYVVALLLAAGIFFGGLLSDAPAQRGQPAERFSAPRTVYSVAPAKWNGKRVVVTGGAGFIGSQLGYFLHKRGYEVTLIDNMEFGYEDNLVVDGERFGTLVVADVLDSRVHKYFEGVDTVFHFAAISALPVCQSNPQRATETNVGGVASMMEATRYYGVRRFIFASTSAVYEENTEATLTENLTVHPHLLYSLGKYQAEQLIEAMSRTYDIDYVILRFFNVFGPHQDFRRKSPPFTSYIIRELVNNRVAVLHSDGKQRRDYVYITDLLDLATRAMESPKAAGEIFNVASGTSYSVNEMYNIAANEIGSVLKPVYHDARSFWDAYPGMFTGAKPIKSAILEKEVNKAVLGSNAKARELLGWNPQVDMKEGLSRMITYIQGLNTNLRKGKFSTAWSDEGKP